MYKKNLFSVVKPGSRLSPNIEILNMSLLGASLLASLMNGSASANEHPARHDSVSPATGLSASPATSTKRDVDASIAAATNTASSISVDNADTVSARTSATKEFTWDDLIPANYRPDAMFEQMDITSLQDGDPKAVEAMEKLRALWKEAPVVNALDGRKIKLGGFAVPLDGDGKITTEFLLVPYYGACIHVPPPPANQAILITLDKPQDIIKQPFDAVWVEGVIKIEKFTNDLADAGYAIKGAIITPYEE